MSILNVIRRPECTMSILYPILSTVARISGAWDKYVVRRLPTPQCQHLNWGSSLSRNVRLKGKRQSSTKTVTLNGLGLELGLTLTPTLILTITLRYMYIN